MLTGNVLITGGSGFLGRGIIRRAKAEGWPARFTVYSRDETKQWELQHRWPDVRCVLGDVARDLDRLIGVMNGHDTVLHAGAIKYIPEAEKNVAETIEVNVVGSHNVAVAALAAGIETVIGISTDKASAPLNTYGMTKALMERLFSEFAQRGRTHFATVRYGNVVGSTGSVIPVFEKQIKEAGEIRITDERMSRFWLSVDDAVDLIQMAMEIAKHFPGATVIGENKAMTIKDLAKAVWQLHWHNYEESGAISVMGIRPGEKLAESLFNAQEAPRAMRSQSSLFGGMGAGFILLPPTAAACNDPLVPAQGYSSDAPVGWLTADEMVKMIREARSV